jgi:hypothetical protein
MTTTPPGATASRRIVPTRLDDDQRQRLRALLDGEEWVRRGDWKRWLDGARPHAPVPIDELPLDDCVASAAWLHQQRHSLYLALEGGTKAPDGWMEGMALYQALVARHPSLTA